jgi:ribosome-binding protein aMBF1 (putative translation factor)
MEDRPLPTVHAELKLAIQQSRLALKMSQKELAHRLCVLPAVIHAYENGTAIPNNAFIAKLEQVLHTKLPRIKKMKRIVSDA